MDKIMIKFLNEVGEHDIVKVEKADAADIIYELGIKSTALLTNRKFINRRYIPAFR
jgi:hypothetical protein